MLNNLVKAKQLVAEKFSFTNWAHLCATYSKRGRIVPNEIVEECMLMYHKLAYHEKQKQQEILHARMFNKFRKSLQLPQNSGA